MATTTISKQTENTILWKQHLASVILS